MSFRYSSGGQLQGGGAGSWRSGPLHIFLKSQKLPFYYAIFIGHGHFRRLQIASKDSDIQNFLGDITFYFFILHSVLLQIVLFVPL